MLVLLLLLSDMVLVVLFLLPDKHCLFLVSIVLLFSTKEEVKIALLLLLSAVVLIVLLLLPNKFHLLLVLLFLLFSTN